MKERDWQDFGIFVIAPLAVVAILIVMLVMSYSTAKQWQSFGPGDKSLVVDLDGQRFIVPFTTDMSVWVVDSDEPLKPALQDPPYLKWPPTAEPPAVESTE